MNTPWKDTMAPEAREALTQALLRIRSLKAQLRGQHTQPIAIVGGAGRFPGAPNLDAYWEMCREGECAIQEIPHSRFHAPDLPVRAGLLDRVDGFDHAFFGLSPAEVSMMDPQHRLLLEVSWEAFEAARIPPSRHASSTGVFVGIMTGDYSDLATPHPDTYTGPGNVACFSAGRISHLLGLQGPAICLDTACSSSLVTVHLACQSLRSGESDLAIAGGCTLILSEGVMELMTRTGALSPSGHSSVFDARADGYVRGEGCAMVVLKRLDDAIRDGDSIWAVIRGSAVNHDGRSSTLTAPSPERQEQVVREALFNAGVDATEIGYIEAHGTGTAIGDPIEVDGLTRILGQAQGCEGRCYIGSGKANTGHMEAAAGVTGLLRAAYVLRHGLIPPQANFSTLNPGISLRGSTLHISDEPHTWGGTQTRYAGVSAFGMSGTNAHAVLEEPPRAQSDARHGDIFAGMLAISAQSNDALDQLRTAYHKCLKNQPWEDLCCAVATRPALSHRHIIHARDLNEADRALTHSAKLEVQPVPEQVPTTLIFGPEPHISDSLLVRLQQHSTPFATCMSACQQAALRVLDIDIFAGDDSPVHKRAHNVALQLSIAAYLVDAGLTLEAVAGLGDGVLAAGVLAGKWDLEATLESLTHASHTLPSTHSSLGLLPAHLDHKTLDSLCKALHIDERHHLLGVGVQDSELLSLSLLDSSVDEHAARALTQLYEAGQIHHWDRVVGKTSRLFSLPHYPWQRHSHWVGEAPETLSRPRWTYEVSWDAYELESPVRDSVVAVFGDTSAHTDAVITELCTAGCHVIRVIADVQPSTHPSTFVMHAADPEELYRLSRTALHTHHAPIERMIHLPWFGDEQGRARRDVMMNLGRTQDSLDCGQWFVTQGAMTSATRQHAQVDAPLWGLGRAFFFESGARGGMLDIAAAPQADTASWTRACLSPLRPKPLQLKINNEGLYHAAIHPTRTDDNPTTSNAWHFDPDATYLVTGGTGGIGRRFVEWMTERGATHIRVTSRRQPSDDVNAWIKDAHTRGVHIKWHGVDVSDTAQMNALFDDITQDPRPLKGIAHIAGVGSQTPVAKLDALEFERVCAPKLTGGWLLHDLSLTHPLDFFLGFSSISSVLAGQGQAAYSAANHALDALIRHRRTSGLPGHTVRWGLWDGEGIPNDEERLRLDQLGLHAMQGARALNMLDTILSEDRTQSIIASIDWARCLNLLDSGGEDLLLKPLRERIHTTQSSQQPSKETHAHSDDEIRQLIVEQVAQHVDMRPEVLPLDRSLTHLGLDSLGGYSLHGTLQNAGISLQIEDMLGGSTVEQLIAQALHVRTTTSPDITPNAPEVKPSPVTIKAPLVDTHEPAFSLSNVKGSASKQWFVNHTPESSGAHRLICFPYAGGNPSVFGGWARHMPEEIELHSLQLPARSARLHEPPVRDMKLLVDALFKAYTELDDRPTSFFGHCFGALMMFELADRLRKEGIALPKNFFVSAARNPRSYTHEQLMADVEQFSPEPPKQLPELDDDMLVEALKEMRFADSVDALDKEAIRRLLLPAVRADFEISNTYFYEEKAPFDIPIFAMGGRADGYVTATQLLSWRHHTTAGFAHEYCPGGHYFIGTERDRWIARILERVQDHQARQAGLTQSA